MFGCSNFWVQQHWQAVRNFTHKTNTFKEIKGKSYPIPYVFV